LITGTKIFPPAFAGSGSGNKSRAGKPDAEDAIQ
jgi:hypothetical protein